MGGAGPPKGKQQLAISNKHLSIYLSIYIPTYLSTYIN